MFEMLIPLGVCLIAWWLGTGIVLKLSGMPENSHKNSHKRVQQIFTLGALVAVAMVFFIKDMMSVWSACLGFVAAIVIWGWLEFMHYSGCLVGPRTNSCPAHLPDRQRFWYALHAMLYHELAMAATGVVLLMISLGGANKTALYTYLVLWVMRVSAELNVFFGVAFLPEEWLPARLQYLMTYRKARKFSLFFPVSVLAATVCCVWMFSSLPAAMSDAYGYTSAVLVGTLLALAIVEHWLLVISVNGTSLWSWAHSRA